MKNSLSGRRALVTLVLWGTILGTACSTAWIGQAEQIAGALIPAVSNVLALVATLEGNSVSAEDAQSIQTATTEAGADLQLIQSLLTQYESADASAQAGILNRIDAAVESTQANLNGILPALHIQDPATRAKVTAMVGIVLSEIEALAAEVRVSSPPTAAQGKAMAMTPHRAPLSAGEFVSAYNAAMKAKTGNAALDRATGRLEIHVHGRLLRWATAGWMK